MHMDRREWIAASLLGAKSMAQGQEAACANCEYDETTLSGRARKIFENPENDTFFSHSSTADYHTRGKFRPRTYNTRCGVTPLTYLDSARYAYRELPVSSGEPGKKYTIFFRPVQNITHVYEEDGEEKEISYEQHCPVIGVRVEGFDIMRPKNNRSAVEILDYQFGDRPSKFTIDGEMHRIRDGYDHFLTEFKKGLTLFLEDVRQAISRRRQ